jgi:hypothetical protein
MKRLIQICAMATICTGAFAQNEMMHLPNGTTGISSSTNSRGVAIGPGFDTPQARLHIRDEGISGTDLLIDMENQLIADTGGTNYLSPDYFIQARFKDNSLGNATFSSQFSVDKNGKIQSGFVNSAVTDQLAVRNNFGIYASVNRNLRFDLANSAARMIWESPNDNFQFVNGDNSTVALQLGENGQVGINTGDFFDDHDLFVDGSVYIKDDGEEDHSLYIEGSAIGEEMFIKLKADWPDYVFTENYELMPLNQLEVFINENGHLPNLPKAEEVRETGLALGETERVLTEKVEELTLYIIELKKEIDTLKEEIKD